MVEQKICNSCSMQRLSIGYSQIATILHLVAVVSLSDSKFNHNCIKLVFILQPSMHNGFHLSV